jgi:3-isopropylmalate/(R)-2-methylmalate dehydratase small subunit
MQPVTLIRGTMAPLPRADVDTDQIVPKQFLKRIERTGYGEFLFHEWAKEESFVLNRLEYREAAVLLTGPNFGCGSSREHAPWALQERGFRAVVAPSFADIFRNNCHKIGLLPVILSAEEVTVLLELADRDPRAWVEIDLQAQTLAVSALDTRFEIDPFVRYCLLNGLDDIALTLEHEPAIADYEARRPSWKARVSARATGSDPG